MRGFFAQVRRGGFDLDLSTAKLTRAMVEVLLQLPPGAAPSKEGILRGSDVNWQEYRVIEGRAAGLILNDEEIQWLRTTWMDATSGD